MDILLWLLIVNAALSCVLTSWLAIEKHRQEKAIAKLGDEVAGIKANLNTKGERHAAALVAIGRKLEEVETLAKRRTRR